MGRRSALATRWTGGGCCIFREAAAPSVVFLPGAGLVGLDFLNIHDRISAVTTSVLYDRAGTGWSDPVSLPRSAAAVAGELRALLRAADVPPPYLLVGHSLGGAYARRYAQRHPDEVAGVLFLEPFYEGLASQGPKRTIGGTLWTVFAALRIAVQVKPFYRRMFGQMLAEWPDSVRGSAARAEQPEGRALPSASGIGPARRVSRGRGRRALDAPY